MDATTLITVGGPVIAAIVAALATVGVAKSRAKVDVGSAITTGFEALTNQLQEERSSLMEIVRTQRVEIATAQAQIEELTGQVRRMRRHIEETENRMLGAGIMPPKRAGWK